MLTVPHVVAGAAIGSLLIDVPGAPYISFGLGWASHYVLDAVPHWERLYLPRYESGFGTHQPASQWPKHVFVQAVLDVLVAFLLLCLLINQRNDAIPLMGNPLFWGAVGGFLPDLIDNVPFWNNYFGKIIPFKYFQKFHELIHISDERNYSQSKYTGLITQIIIVVVGVYLILR